MNDDKLCIFPDALIAMIVTEAQDRALAQMSGPEAAGDVQPSDAFLRKMDALVRNTRRKADRKRHLRAAKRLLIALAVAMAIFSCTMLPVKAVRDAVVQTLMTWHEQFCGGQLCQRGVGRYAGVSDAVLSTGRLYPDRGQ